MINPDKSSKRISSAKSGTVIVRGNSMFPFVREGDILLTKQVQPALLKRGNIVVFSKPEGQEGLVIHRVIDIAAEGREYIFRTKGDNNLFYDSRVTEDQLVSRATSIIRDESKIDLGSPFAGFVGSFFAFLSSRNINVTRAKRSIFSSWLRDSAFAGKFIALFFAKEVRLFSFQLDSGERSLKAFAGQRLVARGTIRTDPEELRLAAWTVPFPFYHSEQGANFLKELAAFAKSSGHSYLAIEKLQKGNHLRRIAEALFGERLTDRAQDGSAVIQL